MTLREAFQGILDRYIDTRRTVPFGRDNDVARFFDEIVEKFREHPAVRNRPTLHVRASWGQGSWAKIPWIALLDARETTSPKGGVYGVFLFRQDMAGVYLTFNQGVTEPKTKHGTKEARRILRARAEELRRLCEGLTSRGFRVDDNIDLGAERGLGADYEHSTIAYKFYPRESLPDDAEIMRDVEALLGVYDRYLEGRPEKQETALGQDEESQVLPSGEFRLEEAVWHVVRYIEARGFFFEPWQVAQYVTALRTKPFVILAGITGTGKSKLPALVGEATGSEVRLVPVRPDWTDSSDVLGYVDLQGSFRAGQVLEVVRAAQDGDDRFWVCIVDEMNLARVEQYFAEILSRIEERAQSLGNGFASPPLVTYPLKEEDAEWGNVGLPTNLALVGTVNMDETTHGFSRKVLDRAFTLELSDVDLTQWGVRSTGDDKPVAATTWPVEAWQPRAVRLGALTEVSEEDREEIERVVKALLEVNRFLTQAQLQVGYRTRDEIALFLLHARDLKSAFVTRSGDQVDPLDLALQMKILPRIIGGSAAVRRAVVQMLGWAFSGSPHETEDEGRTAVRAWAEAGRPGAVPNARFPRTAARLCLMFERFQEDGFASFWL